MYFAAFSPKGTSGMLRLRFLLRGLPAAFHEKKIPYFNIGLISLSMRLIEKPVFLASRPSASLRNHELVASLLYS